MTDLGKGHENEPALSAKIAVMKDDMLSFAEPLRDVQILDENGKPLLASDTNRRFFEGAWMHKFNGKYYFSYSTGDTHLLCYAEGTSPYGPFTYKGVIMNPVEGWTTHHSIVDVKGNGIRSIMTLNFRGNAFWSVKVRELLRDGNGNIKTITP